MKKNSRLASTFELGDEQPPAKCEGKSDDAAEQGDKKR